MRSLNSVVRLIPILSFVMILAPTAGDLALAQSDVKLSPQGVMVQDVTPEQRARPGLTIAREPLAIDVAEGLSTERVAIGRDDLIAVADDQSVGDADDLSNKIEFFKGGEIVVLTIVPGGEAVPIGARIDSVKSDRRGPTDLIPFRSPDAGAARPDGPTNLIPSRLRVTEAALRDGPAKLIPPPSPVSGAALRDLPADGGVLVTSVERGSTTWQDGLRRADVISAANRILVRDIAGLATALASAGPTVVLEVSRSGKEVIVVLHR